VPPQRIHTETALLVLSLAASTTGACMLTPKAYELEQHLQCRFYSWSALGIL
jgi:hypothetical protein